MRTKAVIKRTHIRFTTNRAGIATPNAHSSFSPVIKVFGKVLRNLVVQGFVSNSFEMAGASVWKFYPVKSECRPTELT